jgi:hypothetical protein
VAIMGKRESILRGLALIKPADIAVGVLYAALFVLFLTLSLRNLGAAGSVLVQSSGDEYRYSFDEDRVIDFEGPVGLTTIEISAEGQARFVHSDCRDQICVHAGWLSRGGEWAACLPNRVILRIDSVGGDAAEDDETPEIDATAF